MSEENHSSNRVVTFIGLVALLISCMAVTTFLTRHFQPHLIRQVTTCPFEQPDHIKRSYERRFMQERETFQRHRFERRHDRHDQRRYRHFRRHSQCEKTPRWTRQEETTIRMLRPSAPGPHTVILLQESEIRTN